MNQNGNETAGIHVVVPALQNGYPVFFILTLAGTWVLMQPLGFSKNNSLTDSSITKEPSIPNL